MSDEGPKLFSNKPKKSKLKASTSTSTMASSTSTGPTAPPPPPPPLPPVKESFVQRFKFYKTLAVVVSLTVGVYAFSRTVLKVGPYKEEKTESPTTSTSSSTTTAPATATAAAITEEPVILPTVDPIQQPPILENQQRELYKWMLEEKRKVKPRDPEEKKRIDEEKSILKQFIRAKSLPKI